jgi:hypothetical protein
MDLTPEQLVAALLRVSQGAHNGAYRGMGKAAAMVKGVAMKYSSPGTTPFSKAPFDTGRYRAAMYSKVKEEAETIIGTVGNKAGYGLYIELGTSRMAARPVIQRSITDSEADIGKTLAEETFKGIREAAYL